MRKIVFDIWETDDPVSRGSAGQSPDVRHSYDADERRYYVPETHIIIIILPALFEKYVKISYKNLNGSQI